MPHILRLHKLQDNWGLSLGRCGGIVLELCCEPGMSTGVDEGGRSEITHGMMKG